VKNAEKKGREYYKARQEKKKERAGVMMTGEFAR